MKSRRNVKKCVEMISRLLPARQEGELICRRGSL